MRQLLAASLIGLTGWVGCVPLAGCGDVDEAPAESGWSVGGEGTTVGMSADCSETIEPTWFTEQPSMWYQPTFFGFSPNSGLLLRTDAVMSNAVALRAVDGELFYANVGMYAQSVDRHWKYEARGRGYTRNIDIVDRASDEVVTTVELDEANGWVSGTAFGPSGELFAATSCDDEGLRVTVWSIAAGESVLSVELDVDGRCNGYYSPTPDLEYTSDGSALLVTQPASGKLAHIDLSSGHVTSVLSHEPAEGDHQTLPVEGVLDLAVHPSGELAATSGVDGKVRFWKLPSLEPAGEPLSAGVAGVNVNTYAPPHRVSPLEWTPDGELLAMMSTEGDVVLRERNGDLVSTLAMPEVEGWVPDGTTGGIVNPPMAIAFDGAGQIGVGSYLGAGIWTCGEDVPEHRDGELDVQVVFDGPEQMRVNEQGVFRVHVDGVEGPVVMRMVVDGEHHVWPRNTGTFNWYAHEPGTVRMLLEVDDGTASASRELVVEITPDPTTQR